MHTQETDEMEHRTLFVNFELNSWRDSPSPQAGSRGPSRAMGSILDTDFMLKSFELLTERDTEHCMSDRFRLFCSRYLYHNWIVHCLSRH